MRVFFLLALCACACVLSADRIVTTDQKAFEGVVIVFDKERKLTLATGYGNLTFTVRTEVASGDLGEYEWPKTSTAKKPARDARFETWVKENAERARAHDKAKGLPDNWKTVPVAKEENELELAKVADPISDMKNAKESETAAQQKARRDKIIETLKGKWAYCSFRVESVKKEGEDVIRLTLSGQMFDPQTGKEMHLGWKKGFSIIARKEWDAAAVDKENESRTNPEEYGTRWADEYVMDFERASSLKAGDGVVFKLAPHFDAEGEDWDRIPTRFAPKARPVPRGQ